MAAEAWRCTDNDVGEAARLRFSYGRTFLLGIGFLGTSVVWAVYNTFLPPVYESFVGSAFIVGLIMTIDNVLALLLQPWVGARSDRTWTRFGRRLPYIMVGMPLAGLLLFAVPTAAGTSLLLLLGVTVIMNIGMALSRAPIISLMPDMTPSRHRSTANGIINLMGGLGGGIALFLGKPLEAMHPAYPFYLAGAVAIVVPVLLRLFIRERETLPQTATDAGASDSEGVGTVVTALRKLWQSRDRSALLLLLAIFLWFIAFAGAEALFSLYGERVLGITPGEAGETLLFMLAAVVIFALPAGLLGQRFGRRRVILAGLTLFGLMFLALWQLRDLGLMRLVLPFGGIGWALIVVNSLPMVLELGRGREAGLYTGIYYVASMLANIAGPPLLGGLMERIGNETLFLWSALAVGLAATCMLFVRRGEALTTDQRGTAAA